MKMINKVDKLKVGPVEVDFSGSGVTPAEVEKTLAAELKRLNAQLKPGYRFKSDRELPPDKVDGIENHLIADGRMRFHAYEADVAGVAAAADRIKKAHGIESPVNVVVIGNGGSISSSEALYTALIRFSTAGKYSGRRLVVVDTMDPDFIAKVRGECRPEETIVLAVSKSGATQGVLDALSQFAGYKVAAVTTKRAGKPLYEAVNKLVGGKAGDVILEHPHIGGRYAGRTLVGTLPLALLGMDAGELSGFDRGALDMYRHVNPDVRVAGNPALRLAATLYCLERKGRDIIFAPTYSHRFDGFSHLMTQLLHEGSGKAGEGQTLLALPAPESQHNTNQRLFGGKRSMAAVFFTIAEPEAAGLKAPDGTPLEDALGFEYQGTRDDAAERGVPSVTVRLDAMTPAAAGALMAFLQWGFGVYPALLRDVNPLDQPQVERSKDISRGLRENRQQKPN